MAYARTSAGPAGRPGAALSQLRPDRMQNFDFSPLLIWKSHIGLFYCEELKAMGRKEGRREGEKKEGTQILSTHVDEYMKFSGSDLVQNCCFQKVKLANVGGFSDF